MSADWRKFSMKMPGRSETTAGRAASNSFSISRAGPTGPGTGPVGPARGKGSLEFVLHLTGGTYRPGAGAAVSARAREDNCPAHTSLLRRPGGLLRALDCPNV